MIDSPDLSEKISGFKSSKSFISAPTLDKQTALLQTDRQVDKQTDRPATDRQATNIHTKTIFVPPRYDLGIPEIDLCCTKAQAKLEL